MLKTLFFNALKSGLTATATSTAALVAAAAAEGRGLAQPLNATSHILYGKEAAAFRDADLDHTIVGLATHAAATVFWATAFEAALVFRPANNRLSLAGRAASIGLLAALVDYTITPRRLTPGWELVLSKTSMGLAYGAMAAGFAAAASKRLKL